jgi:16S rRNA G966 N2-methylase RsmD
MAKKARAAKTNVVRESPDPAPKSTAGPSKPSSLVDMRVIYCGGNLEQLRKLPDSCVDLMYIDPPFNSNGHQKIE